MADRQVTCINKRQHYNPYERITHIGGAWGKTTQEMAITEIKYGLNRYYVQVYPQPVLVIVAKHNGHEYLKTVPDDIAPGNLLNLPECA